MYIKRGVNYEIISNKCVVKNMWILAIKIKNPRMKGTYAVIYHSPSTNDGEFIDMFESWCDENINFKEPITICGDFNINLMTKSCYSDRIMSVIQSLGLKQIVRNPTRVTEHSKTLIDFVVTNNYNMKATVLGNDKVSDHSTITFSIGAVEMEMEFLSSHLKLSIKEFIKSVTMSNANTKVWYNQDLEEQRRKRDDLYKVAYITGDQNDWHIYVDVSKEYVKVWNVKATKNNYFYNKLLSTKDNQI